VPCACARHGAWRSRCRNQLGESGVGCWIKAGLNRYGAACSATASTGIVQWPVTIA
jgi:hypothetical protein